jgi:hypothetical protein
LADQRRPPARAFFFFMAFFSARTPLNFWAALVFFAGFFNARKKAPGVSPRGLSVWSAYGEVSTPSQPPVTTDRSKMDIAHCGQYSTADSFPGREDQPAGGVRYVGALLVARANQMNSVEEMTIAID